ncbi:MAG: hypothetical protein ACE10G_01865 [Gemmatimonadales bacterium]
MSRAALIVVALLLTAPLVASEQTDRQKKGEWKFSGSAGVEQRWFWNDASFTGQLEGGQGSLTLEPEFRFRSADRKHQVNILPFLRVDGEDDERSHFDLREAYYRYVGDDWELLVGVNRVFWGVTESLHLVDTLNQVDAVEDIDGEDRLGQPMVSVALQRDWGRLEAFVLPRFRERTFPGIDGRLRTPLPVDDDRPVYESGAEDGRVDLALRWSHYIGDWDIGVHAFHGTGREPSFVPSTNGQSLRPVYAVTSQLGIDVQYTRGAWLYKLESLVREGQGDTFGAAVGGFEYTFYQLGRSAMDLGLLAEYLWDDRDMAAPPTPFDDDVFVGSRLGFNDSSDTEILVGAVVDTNNGSISGVLEAERRLSDRFNLEFESRMFANIDAGDPLAALAQDSFVTLRLSIGF